MSPTDSSVHTEVELFRQRLTASQHIYSQAIVAMATEQMSQQPRPAPRSSQRGQLLWVLGRTLIRGFRELCSIALSRSGIGSSGSQRSVVSDDPNIIDGEVIEVSYNPAPICQSSGPQDQWRQNTHLETWIDKSRNEPLVS